MLHSCNMVIEIKSKGPNKCDASTIISMNFIKWEKHLFVVWLTIIWSINVSNSLNQHDSKQHSYNGHFVGEEEARAIAVEANVRLAKIPCNFTTKTNCIYAEQQKFFLPVNDNLQQRHQKNNNEIVVSWVPYSDKINTTHQGFGTTNGTNNIKGNSSFTNNDNKQKSTKNDFCNFNWIFEMLACMMLASAFEICLLMLRNLRNISLAIFGLWSSINSCLKKFCCTSASITFSIKSAKQHQKQQEQQQQQQQQKLNAAVGEKRTLSYIFAILTWRASQTAKGDTTNTEPNLRDETDQNSISYGHVTTMGDLLLLILFTHVYYQKQKFEGVENDVSAEPAEHILNNHQNNKELSHSMYKKFHDKQNTNNNNNNNNKNYTIINKNRNHNDNASDNISKNFNNTDNNIDSSTNKNNNKKNNIHGNNNDNDNDKNNALTNKHGSNTRCSHSCGNMYQQQISLLEERKFVQAKLKNSISCTNKMLYLNYCIPWYTCCLCQYSYRSCCYCCNNCRQWDQHCYIYMPLCNTIYCCCFYKSLKSFYDVQYQYPCCYPCCCQDFCHINSNYRCCCHFCCTRAYNHCCLYNLRLKETPVRTVNLFLLNNICNPSTDYCVWKLKWNNQSYTLLYEINGQCYYSAVYLTDCKSMILCKRSHYQSAIDMLRVFLPQYLLSLKNCPSFLKWKKFHVAVVVMALIFICASGAGGADYNHHHYYSSLLNKCNKHFSKCQQNKKRRRRRRRRYQHQHCKAYRPQHYFYTTLIQCVKRQKPKKIQKKFLNKPHKKSLKVLTPSTTNYENTLAPVVITATITTTTKTPLVRAIRRVRGTKPNIVWLLIGLIWFEGPKIVNCNVIINYQNHQQNEQQQQQQEQYQQTSNSHKQTTTITNNVNSNIDYKIDNLSQVKAKNGNNNSNNNDNNNSNNKINNNNNNKNKINSSSSSGISSSSSSSIINNINNNNNNNNNKSSTDNSINVYLAVNNIPTTSINTKHLKHCCNSNYHQKFIRSTQRVQSALKTNPTNLDTSVTSSASINYNNVNDDFDSEQEQLPSSLFQTINEESHTQSDLMRLESIKHQILFKLGLTRKPNVSHPLPKQFIWDTIYRADGIKSFHEFSNSNNVQDHQQFTPQNQNPYWSTTQPKGSNNILPIKNYQQRQQQRTDRHDSLKNSEYNIENIKRSLKGINPVRKKYGKNKQKLQSQRQQQQQQDKPQAYTDEHYKNNDIIYQKSVNSETSISKNLDQLLYTTKHRNKFLNLTNNMINNFTLLKQEQEKHRQFHKNSQHSTTTVKRPTIIHQQQQLQQHRRQQHEQISQYTNKNNNNNNKNTNKNNNNVNNSNNNNNIDMVQNHLRNNNKYTEEAKKFTYLTDISSSDDSINNMEEYHNHHSDDINSIVRKQNHGNNLQQQHQQQKHNDVPYKKTSTDYQYFNIDADIGNSNMESEVILGHEDDNNNKNADDDDDDDADDDTIEHQKYNQHHHRHDNHVSKLDAFDENDEFFGSTQEIITFAEKGKIYKNHRLVEFSHQNNVKPKQALHVRNAEIHIRIDKISSKNKSRAGSGIKRKRLKIWIFQLIENNYNYKGFDHVAQFCASFDVDTSHLGWKKFDITTTVKEWYSRRESEKLRLLIDCTGCGKMYSVHLFNGNNGKGDASFRDRRIAEERRNANVNDINSKHVYDVIQNNENYSNLLYNQTLIDADDDENNRKNNSENADEDVLKSTRPFLVLHTEARRQRRVRRRAINCNGALHGQCCKESFYVSFKALGWDDWIIAPRGYFANYCRGDCTGPYRTPDTFQTFHAHFIEEYRKMGLLNGMQPCCAPIKFSSMSLIYYGDEGIIKRDLPKMVVDECGCP